MKDLFTDLHTHILPEMDDGAETVGDAIKLLQMQRQQGVARVALTPHYYPAQEEPDAFLDRRQKAYDALMQQWDGDTMPHLRLGAEVGFAPVLTHMDMRRFAIEGTDYLLLELPDETAPFYVNEVVKEIFSQGITPILAHVERCAYFRHKPEHLYQLIQMGALAQVSAISLWNRNDNKFVDCCFQKGLVHIIASDAHRMNMKPPCLGNVISKIDYVKAQWAEEFARSVWDNLHPPIYSIQPMKLGLFGYR